MKHLLKLFIFMMTLSAFAYGQSHSSQQTRLNPVWITFSSPTYTIKYPLDWKIDQTGELGTTFLIKNKLTGSEDTFQENVNLLVQNLSGLDLDLEAYVKLSREQINELAPNSNILKGETVETDAGTHYEITYTADQGGRNLTFKQYYWVIGKEAYVLTLTCESSQYEAYRKIGKQILDSFQLL